MITFSLKSIRIYPNPGSRARPLAKKPQSQRTKVSCHALGKDSSSLSPQRAVPHPLLVSWARLRALLLAPMLPALVHSVWPVPACQLPALLAPLAPSCNGATPGLGGSSSHRPHSACSLLWVPCSYALPDTVCVCEEMRARRPALLSQGVCESSLGCACLAVAQRHKRAHTSETSNGRPGRCFASQGD